MDIEKNHKLHSLFKERGYTIATAESMTAGLLASTIASLPGASSILLGGIVSYSIDIKTKILNVDKSLIEEYTAESAIVTKAMAEGLVGLMGANVSVAITGAAGASVNNYEIRTSVGSVFVCIIVDDKYYEFQEQFDGDRNQVREETVNFIMEKIIGILSIL